MLFEVYPDAKLNTRALYTFTISSLMDVSTTWGAQTTRYCVGEILHHLQLPGCSATDVSSQLNLQHHLLWSSGYLGYPAFTITSDITFLALGVKKGPGEGGHGDTGRREDKKDKLGCATMKSSSYCCTALGSSPQPQPVPISRVATSVLSLNTLLSNTLSSRSHLIPV